MMRLKKANLKAGFDHHYQFNPADVIASEEVLLQNKDGTQVPSVMIWIRGLAQPITVADPDRLVQDEIDKVHRWGNTE